MNMSENTVVDCAISSSNSSNNETQPWWNKQNIQQPETLDYAWPEYFCSWAMPQSRENSTGKVVCQLCQLPVVQSHSSASCRLCHWDI